MWKDIPRICNELIATVVCRSFGLQPPCPKTAGANFVKREFGATTKQDQATTKGNSEKLRFGMKHMMGT